MAGHRKGPTSPASRELRAALDKILKTAAGFDRIEPGAGERIRRDAAAALLGVSARAVGGGQGRS